MEDNDVLFQKEADLMRNEIVADTFENYRLLGWTDQFEEDDYWVILTRRVNVGVALESHSCVGSFKRLRGVLSNKDYDEIDRGWNLNNASVEDGLRLAKERGIIIK